LLVFCGPHGAAQHLVNAFGAFLCMFRRIVANKVTWTLVVVRWHGAVVFCKFCTACPTVCLRAEL